MRRTPLCLPNPLSLLQRGQLFGEAGHRVHVQEGSPAHASDAENLLEGKRVDAKAIAGAAEAAMAAADPQSDQRGTAAYKRQLVRGLVTEALEAALRRAAGERVEVVHHYA